MNAICWDPPPFCEPVLTTLPFPPIHFGIVLHRLFPPIWGPLSLHVHVSLRLVFLMFVFHHSNVAYVHTCCSCRVGMHQALVVYKLWVLCVCTWRLWYTSMQPVWLLWHLRGNACGKQASGPVWCHRVLVVDKLAAWLGHAQYASVAAYCSRQLTCVCDRVVAGQQDPYVEPGCVLQWQWSKVRE